jgi:hypothetical protein
VRCLRFAVTTFLMCFAVFPRRVPAQDSTARVTIRYDASGKASGLSPGWGCPALVGYGGSGTRVRP